MQNAADWFAEFLAVARGGKLLYNALPDNVVAGLRRLPLTVEAAPVFDISGVVDSMADDAWDALMAEAKQRIADHDLHLPYPQFFLIEVESRSDPIGRPTQMVMIHRVTDTELGICIERVVHVTPPPQISRKLWIGQPVALFIRAGATSPVPDALPALAQQLDVTCTDKAIELSIGHIGPSAVTAAVVLTLLAQPNVIREPVAPTSKRGVRQATTPRQPFPPVHAIKLTGWQYVAHRTESATGGTKTPHDRRSHPRTYYRGTPNEYTIQVRAAKVKGGSDGAPLYLLAKHPRRVR
jgi:hypothetical protein